MKKKTFQCELCQFISHAPQGIAVHVYTKHREQYIRSEIDNKGKLTGHKAQDDPFPSGKWHKADTRTKDEGTKLHDLDNIAENAINPDWIAAGPTRPWYEMLLIEFEGACRASESMMNDDSFKAIKDINPSIYAATVMKTFSDRRAKFLSILKILDEKRLKYDAYERELLR